MPTLDNWRKSLLDALPIERIRPKDRIICTPESRSLERYDLIFDRLREMEDLDLGDRPNGFIWTNHMIALEWHQWKYLITEDIEFKPRIVLGLIEETYSDAFIRSLRELEEGALFAIYGPNECRDSFGNKHDFFFEVAGMLSDFCHFFEIRKQGVLFALIGSVGKSEPQQTPTIYRTSGFPCVSWFDDDLNLFLTPPQNTVITPEGWESEPCPYTVRGQVLACSVPQQRILLYLSGLTDDFKQAWIPFPPFLPGWALDGTVFEAKIPESIESFEDLWRSPWAIQNFKHTPRPYLTDEELRQELFGVLEES